MSRQVAKVLAAQIVNRFGCKAPPDPAIARVASRRVLKRLSVVRHARSPGARALDSAHKLEYSSKKKNSGGYGYSLICVIVLLTCFESFD